MKVIGVSADPPEVNDAFRTKYGLPFLILSDTYAGLADILQVPTSTKHPMAMLRRYPNGFLQPAVFVFDAGGKELFRWIQAPKAANFFARLRAGQPDLRTPDAIQLACAIGGQCEVFLTNDDRLSGSEVADGFKILPLGRWREAV